MLTWRESVAVALMRQAERQRTRNVTGQLIERELPRIVRETGARGATPEQTRD
jgi:hypothetical protein